MHCFDCNSMVANFDSLIGHLLSNRHQLESKTFRCEPCDQWFSSRNTVYSHAKRIHFVISDKSCNSCTANFSNQAKFWAHFKNTHVSDSKDQRFACPCSAVFLSKSVFQVHVKLSHVGLAGKIISKVNPICDGCSRRRCSASDLIDHMIRDHNVQADSVLQCFKCGLSFVTNEACFAHIGDCLTVDEKLSNGTIHWEKYLFGGIKANTPAETSVGATDQRFLNSKDVPSTTFNVDHPSSENGNNNQEVDQLQERTAEFVCDPCGLQFPSSSRLFAHFRSEHNERLSVNTRKHCDYLCVECCRSFSGSSQLQKHMQIHHISFDRRQHTCRFCPACFTSLHALNDHLQTSHKRELKYLCAACGKRFENVGQLWRHHRTHQKQHHCPKCSTAFAQKCELNRHLAVHEDSVFFKCFYCSSQFRQMSSLKNHIKTKHLVEQISHLVE